MCWRRTKFEQTGDQQYVDKAHRRGRVGWNVGRRIEVAPHYQRPHLMLAWTGGGPGCSRKVEKVPSGFGGKE